MSAAINLQSPKQRNALIIVPRFALLGSNGFASIVLCAGSSVAYVANCVLFPLQKCTHFMSVDTLLDCADDRSD